MRHIHSPVKAKAKERCWTYCVAPEVCGLNAERGNAHGGIVREDVCRCGATRLSEHNFGWTPNYGRWQDGNSED